MPVKTRMNPEDIVREHVGSNVTFLVTELAEYGDEWAWDLLHGDPESDQECYPAYEVWVVDDWLGRQLRRHGHRVAVVGLGGDGYWARGGTGQAIKHDTVIEDIARGK